MASGKVTSNSDEVYRPPGEKVEAAELVNYFQKIMYILWNGMFYLWNSVNRCYMKLRKTDIPPLILSKIDKSVTVPSSVIREVITQLTWNPERQVNLEELRQKSQFFLNLKNGVLDIRDGKLYIGEEAEKIAIEYCFTYQLDFNYNDQASVGQALEFSKFAETSLDLSSSPDKLMLLLEIIGICISSVMIARKFYFFVGATKSGKSVMADLIQSVIVPEVDVTAFGLNQLGARFNTQHLEYSRLNICRELTAGKLKGTDILKMLVSDEPLFVEGKGK